jgi:hypothetical protein
MTWGETFDLQPGSLEDIWGNIVQLVAAFGIFCRLKVDWKKCFGTRDGAYTAISWNTIELPGRFYSVFLDSRMKEKELPQIATLHLTRVCDCATERL